MRHTQIARNVLRASGVICFGDALYTNKYPTCRTVKAYVRDQNGPGAVETIMQGLDDAGVQAYNVKFIPGTLHYGGRSAIGSMIVRLPL